MPEYEIVPCKETIYGFHNYIFRGFNAVGKERAVELAMEQLKIDHPNFAKTAKLCWTFTAPGSQTDYAEIMFYQ
jgi:hypothetical protein